MRISVIGGGRISDDEREVAEAVGRAAGAAGHALVCGGRGGTMEAACRGAKAEGGETIGILPTERRADANEYVDTAIATGMGHARNVLVPLNGDGVIALSGSHGTLTEIGFALLYDRPVAGLHTHDVPGLEAVDSPAEAVAHLERAVE